MTFHEKYNIYRVYMGGYYILEHRGRDKKHIEYFVKLLDGTELNVFVPHYFEQVGTERMFAKAIKKHIIEQRNEKINKIKTNL